MTFVISWTGTQANFSPGCVGNIFVKLFLVFQGLSGSAGSPGPPGPKVVTHIRIHTLIYTFSNASKNFEEINL